MNDGQPHLESWMGLLLFEQCPRTSHQWMITPRIPLRGMTLIEILAVVVILGLLAVTLTVGITAKFGKAKHEIAKTQIAGIVAQLQAYQLERRALPSSSQGLKVLSDAPSAIYYLDAERLVDPWGNAYRYLVPGPAGQTFEVLTYGADNQPGGDGENADISSAKVGS